MKKKAIELLKFDILSLRKFCYVTLHILQYLQVWPNLHVRKKLKQNNPSHMQFKNE